MLNEEMPDLELYKAFSAYEALDLMQRTRIDIVVTDIRMPRMSGIELMDHIHQNWPDCRVIFLTGYSEFDYIYSAIKRLGVQYLLKTEEDDVIVSAVTNAIEDIKRFRMIGDQQPKGIDQLLLQKEFLEGVLQGITKEDEITSVLLK